MEEKINIFPLGAESFFGFEGGGVKIVLYIAVFKAFIGGVAEGELSLGTIAEGFEEGKGGLAQVGGMRQALDGFYDALLGVDFCFTHGVPPSLFLIGQQAVAQLFL